MKYRDTYILTHHFTDEKAGRYLSRGAIGSSHDP